MALVLKRIHQGLLILDELQDERTHGNAFVASPLCLIGAIAFYVYFFKKLGPKFMENRKPYNVKNIMIAYNVLQIAFNAYLVLKCALVMARMKSLLCEDIDYSRTPESMNIVYISKCYMYLKLFDIGDTLFFLLRKSFRQISFLHLYHHSGMLTLVWIGFRHYGGGGSGQWIVLLNCAVHVVMFTYYLLTSIDSSWKNSFRFKRSLTQMQLVQFVCFILIFGNIAVYPTCNVNRFLALVFACQNVFMLFLFGEFYYTAYVKPRKIDTHSRKTQ
ncbi:unnamed protein product [Phyllotreta striolata]|uniref:Elongation of very long chain fatty acids protein n=1 Tax=Phyllotreta striolata TaxID=444603 RepID=A0A9N9XSW1_PHYSR|nr:unnamed protein product [Phyllotreta striolata]